MYLREVALALGKLQQVFLAPNEHDWQYGLLISETGLATQQFEVNGQPVQAVLDMQAAEVRLGQAVWPLADYSAPEIFANLRIWLVAQGVQTLMQVPEFSTTSVNFEPSQAKLTSEVLIRMNGIFNRFSYHLENGLVSPILLYPHHFDLSLVWFPLNTEYQVSLGFSFGDETIPEPYIYLTAYPEPHRFKELAVEAPAHLQTAGFSGMVLLYKDLEQQAEPEEFIESFASSLFMQLREP